MREKGVIFGNFSVFCPYFREKSCYRALSLKFQKFSHFLQHDIFYLFFGWILNSRNSFQNAYFLALKWDELKMAAIGIAQKMKIGQF